jgi:NTE family protein
MTSLKEQKETIMASAAVPILFGAKEVGQHAFADGGMGGWKTMQGNTPITPLIEAGYKTIIVTHLSDGSLWNRHDYPDVTLLEIRPQSDIARKGYKPDLLSFNATHIPSWIEQGYHDTIRCLYGVIRVTQARNTLKSAECDLQNSKNEWNALDVDLDDAMGRIK